MDNLDYLDLFAVLTILATTSMGLLALWAATSRRAWYWRAAVFALPLAAIVAIPAYEPYVYFLAQFAVVLLGIHAWRHMKRRVWPSLSALRFSLKSLLFFSFFAALFLAVASQLPMRSAPFWLHILFAGFIAGLSIVFPVWLICEKQRLRWRLLIALSIVPTIAMGGLLILVSEFHYEPSWVSSSVFSNFNPVRWLAVMPGVIGATTAWLALLRVAGWLPINDQQDFVPNNQRKQVVKTLARTSLMGLTLLFVLPCIVVCYRLQKRPVIPQPTISSPNGFDDILAAESLLTKSNVLEDFDSATASALTLELPKNRKAFELLRIGLSKPSEIHVDYHADIEVERSQGLRSLARALAAEGRLAELEGRNDDAAQSYLDIIRLSHSIDRGGLAIDWLVARAIEGIGIAALAPIRTKLASGRIDATVRALTTLEQQREPIEAVVHRDIVWAEVAYGWRGRLFHLFERLAFGQAESSYGYLKPAELRSQTLSRLMILELGIQAYRLKHGQLPEQLEDLSPEPWLIHDPLAADKSSSFRFVRKDDGYLLYSVGRDGDDDGGTAKPYLADDGDLTGDSPYFQDDEVVEDTAGE